MKSALKKVFISHAAADTKAATDLAKSLRAERIDTWSEANLLPGDDWRAESSSALENSDAVIVLMTENSGSAPNVRRDVEFALGSRKFANRVIPVMVGDQAKWSGSWVLKRLQPVRVRGNFAAAGKEIAQALDRKR